ncbi:MAG: GNAT family N-acetyltransferase [Actinomycetota bacterium]|nr:GNAT family N-acetyltransferase [Actinomycetota bacterium]
MADVGVRTARERDVAAIAEIQLVTWRTAYRDVLPPTMLEGLTVEAIAEHWGAAVASPPSARHRVLVANEGSVTVGFAAIGPAEEEGHDPPSTGSVSALLVEPRWGRRGHGSRLLAAGADLMRADGCRLAVTWLLEPDQISARFFRSAGWAPDGAARALDMDGRFVRELRMHVDLTDPSGDLEQ